MRLLLSVCVNAVMAQPHPPIHQFHPSYFHHFCTFQYSLLRTLPHVANFPAVDAVCREFVHHLLFAVVSYANEQSSAGLRSVPLQEPEVLHLILDLDESTVDGQFIDHQIHFGLLRLCQVVGVTEDAEASHISTGTRPVFPQKSRTNQAQCSHLLLRPVKGLQQLRLSHLLQDFISFFLAGLEPLHGIDGQSGSQWFGEDDGVSGSSVVGHHELFIPDDCDGASTHHGPLVVDGLSSTHLSPCLLGCIREALDHQCGRHVLLLLAHVR